MKYLLLICTDEPFEVDGATMEAERRYLQRRLREVESGQATAAA